MLENKFWCKVTQYTFVKNDRPLKIEQRIYASGGEEWEIIDFGFIVARFKTALEVKAYLGARPMLKGAYEVYNTPVGRTIEKRLYGIRMY